MKKIITVAVLAALITTLSAIVTQVYAADVVTTTNCKPNYIGRGHSCQTISTTPDAPEPRRALTNKERAEQNAYYAALDAERTARIEKWEAFCKPVVVQGEDGISRYTYAHKNCDMGRSQ